MGNSISENTDYRIHGHELIALNKALGETCYALDYHAQHMVETLNNITDTPESITKAIARFGELAVRANEIRRDYNRRLNLFAFGMVHTPIAKEDNNGDNH